MHLTKLSLLFVFLGLVLLPSLASAVEIEAGEGAILQEFDDMHADIEAHHSEGGLPQFNPESFASQIFWLALVFGVMYMAFSQRILPSLSGILEDRRTRIQDDLSLADQLTNEAEAAQNQYENDLASARQKAQSTLQEVHQAAQQQAESAHTAFQGRMKKEMDALAERLQNDKAKIMRDMQDDIADIAQEAAHKIAMIEPDKKKTVEILRKLAA